MDECCHGFIAGKLRQWLLVSLRELKTNLNPNLSSNPNPCLLVSIIVFT